MVDARPKAKRGCREEVSLVHCLGACFVDDGRHNVSQDLHSVLHGADPGVLSGVGRRRHNVGDGLTEARDPKGLLGLPDPFQQGKTFGLELRDGNFFHGQSR